jgi:glutamine amidotransferase
MKISIINYNAGNVQSVLFAMKRLGIKANLTDNIEEIQKSDKVIFPGVGEASSTMAFLKEKKLDSVIINLKQPVLGICLGMQLMCAYSEENETPCLGIFPSKVRKFLFTDPKSKVPHMGWNLIQDLKGDIFDESLEGAFTYFVHGFYVEKNEFTTATCDYIIPFSAAIQKENFYATQFHPEKSGSVGERILTNFLTI